MTLWVWQKLAGRAIGAVELFSCSGLVGSAASIERMTGIVDIRLVALIHTRPWSWRVLAKREGRTWDPGGASRISILVTVNHGNQRMRYEDCSSIYTNKNGQRTSANNIVVEQ